jgi:uncharacterized protein
MPGSPMRSFLSRSSGLLALALMALLTACSHQPLRFYTLVSPAVAEGTTAEAGPLFDLLPVAVPAQVDVPQLRVRRGAAELCLLEGHHWAAPLPEEIRAALARRLGERYHARDLRRQPGPIDAEVAQIRVDVQRFEVQPEGRLQVEALWTVLRGGTALRCHSRLTRVTGPAPEAWVLGYQSALAEMADGIGAVLTGADACP